MRRRSLTLSDQLSMVSSHQSTNLRDLLKLPDPADPCANRSPGSSPSSSPWRTLRDLLQLHPSANPNPPSTGIDAPRGSEAGGTEPQPVRVSLMALLEEGEGNGNPSTAPRNVGDAETSQADSAAAAAAQDELVRVSLLALLEQSERNFSCGSFVEIGEEEEEQAAAAAAAQEEAVLNVCCVCMVRRKGAAFIPCGHTFCRRCSRELHMGRGTCPLCNGAIAEVLDIF